MDLGSWRFFIFIKEHLSLDALLITYVFNAFAVGNLYFSVFVIIILFTWFHFVLVNPGPIFVVCATVGAKHFVLFSSIFTFSFIYNSALG